MRLRSRFRAAASPISWTICLPKATTRHRAAWRHPAPRHPEDPSRNHRGRRPRDRARRSQRGFDQRRQGRQHAMGESRRPARAAPSRRSLRPTPRTAASAAIFSRAISGTAVRGGSMVLVAAWNAASGRSAACGRGRIRPVSKRHRNPRALAHCARPVGPAFPHGLAARAAPTLPQRQLLRSAAILQAAFRLGISGLRPGRRLDVRCAYRYLEG